MKEKIVRFMQGRYGADELSRFLVGLSFVFIILGMFTRNAIFSLLFWAAIIYCYYRVFSKQFVKRQHENQIYLNTRYKVKAKWYQITHKKGFNTNSFNTDSIKKEWNQRKNYHIYKCPNCKQKIRIPRGKGKIEISCPKCYTKFIKKS